MNQSESRRDEPGGAPSKRRKPDASTTEAPQPNQRRERAAPELRLTVDGRLQFRGEHDWTTANPVRCFPWSDANSFISLRDDDQNELLLIEDPRDLDIDSRHALNSALAVAGFVLKLTSVESVEEDFEIRAWKVVTDRGARSFQTELDAWPVRLPSGGHLIEDIGGDVYYVPPLSTFDEKSQKLLWPYID